MNSLYGAFGNIYFRLFDLNVAEAITLSGQLSIRWAEKAVNEKLNFILETDGVDYVIAIDTDSLYINFGPLVKKFSPKNPVDFLDSVCKDVFEQVLKKSYKDLFDYLSCYTNRMEMKRESIANRGIWCVHPDTMVKTSIGEYKISDLYKELGESENGINVLEDHITVSSFDIKNQKIVQDKIDLSLRKWYEGDMYELEYQGKKIHVTGDHKVLTYNKDTEKFDRWIKAKFLTEEDQLMI